MATNNKLDPDGFMVLIPRGEGTVKSTPSYYPRPGNTIGDNPLVKLSRAEVTKMGKAQNSTCFRINGGTDARSLVTLYQPKAWQNKAWALIGKGINWTDTPAFRDTKKASKKLKHVIRIGVALKVRANIPVKSGRNNAKPVIWQMTKKDSTFGMYTVAEDKKEIVTLFEVMYDQMYNHVDEIVKTIDAWGYAEAVFFMKAMVIYDDKSFDTVSGDPRNLFRLLDIVFDSKGMVKL